MSKQEMQERIDKLEAQRFYLSMKDRWSQADFDTDRKWWTEILDLKKKLAEM